MNRPAVFFDRDNTLIACDEYLGDASKVQLVDGAADAVARARELGYATVIFSNQSGVARGYFSEEAVHAVNARLDEMLRDANPSAAIDRHEFCPFHPDASIEKYRQDSPLRKPGAGMIHSAAEALQLDLSRSWVIGDAPRDIDAGRAAGCQTVLFTDPSLKPSPAAAVQRGVEPDYVCTTLAEAMEIIAQHTPTKQEVIASPAADEVRERSDVGQSDPVERQNEPVAVAAIPASPSASPHGAREAEQQARGAEQQPFASQQARGSDKLEILAADILHELRRRHEQPVADFSVSKLLAGVVQVIVLAVLFLAFLNRGDDRSLMPLLTFALTLQTMTIAMLIMGKQH